MKTMSILLVAVVCAPAAAAPLHRPPGAVNCIDSHATARPDKSEDSILFAIDGKTYRNHLPDACPGISRLGGFSALETEPHGPQLCVGDTVRVFDPATARSLGGLSGIDAYPRCRLGAFEPISPAPGH